MQKSGRGVLYNEQVNKKAIILYRNLSMMVVCGRISNIFPEFETDEAHDYFVSRFFVREGFYDDIDSEGNENTSEKKVAIKSGEKKRRKKVLKKSTEKKITEKTMQNYNAILDYMQYGEWYKTLDFIEVLDVKDSRIRKILNELEAKGELISKGSTKGKVYQKVEK